MILRKKMSGQWAKQGVDFKNNDIIKILDSGTEQEGQYGTQVVFRINVPSGEERLMPFNQTSLNNLIDYFGEDSEKWAGQKVRIELIKQNVGGQFKMVAYIFPIDASSQGDGLEEIPFG